VTVLLGGDACPLGLNVQYLEAPHDEVVPVLADIWSPTGLPIEITNTGVTLPRGLDFLLPFEAPWTRMLVAPAGDWIAVVNNFVDGGDSSAPCPAVSRHFGVYRNRGERRQGAGRHRAEAFGFRSVRCVVATHAPLRDPGHAATQLEVFGPEGEYPSGIRALSVHAIDGRWGWDESGVPFAFEETERYSARLKRHRFDREMLLRYLAALGIPVDDDAYGVATLLQHVVDWPTGEQTLAEARAAFGG
jgi:hypothetical protein